MDWIRKGSLEQTLTAWLTVCLNAQDIDVVLISGVLISGGRVDGWVIDLKVVCTIEDGSMPRRHGCQ
jgi:hypothetical protein